MSGFPAVVIAGVLDRELPKLLVQYQDHVEDGRLHPQYLADLRSAFSAIRAARHEWLNYRRAVSADGSSAEEIPAVTEVASGSVREISTDRASTILGVSPARVRQLLRAGALPGRQEGRMWLVPADAVHAYRGGHAWDTATVAATSWSRAAA